MDMGCWEASCSCWEANVAFRSRVTRHVGSLMVHADGAGRLWTQE